MDTTVGFWKEKQQIKKDYKIIADQNINLNSQSKILEKNILRLEKNILELERSINEKEKIINNKEKIINNLEDKIHH